jgi:hypothetical protein
MPDDSLFRQLTRREASEMVARGLLDPGDPRIWQGRQPQLLVNKLTGTIHVTNRFGQDEREQRLDSNVRLSGFDSVRATFPMSKRYVGEEVVERWGTKVKYLTTAEREAYRLEVRDGKLYDATGQPFDTRDAQNYKGATRAIFVMDAEGNLYASKTQEAGSFHHSSLLGGTSVAAAGEMEVEQGVLKVVTRKSGHYHPSAVGSLNLRKALQTRGVYLGETHWTKGWGLHLDEGG